MRALRPPSRKTRSFLRNHPLQNDFPDPLRVPGPGIFRLHLLFRLLSRNGGAGHSRRYGTPFRMGFPANGGSPNSLRLARSRGRSPGKPSVLPWEWRKYSPLPSFHPHLQPPRAERLHLRLSRIRQEQRQPHRAGNLPRRGGSLELPRSFPEGRSGQDRRFRQVSRRGHCGLGESGGPTRGRSSSSPLSPP